MDPTNDAQRVARLRDVNNRATRQFGYLAKKAAARHDHIFATRTRTQNQRLPSIGNFKSIHRANVRFITVFKKQTLLHRLKKNFSPWFATALRASTQHFSPGQPYTYVDQLNQFATANNINWPPDTEDYDSCLLDNIIGQQNNVPSREMTPATNQEEQESNRDADEIREVVRAAASDNQDQPDANIVMPAAARQSIAPQDNIDVLQQLADKLSDTQQQFLTATHEAASIRSNRCTNQDNVHILQESANNMSDTHQRFLTAAHEYAFFNRYMNHNRPAHE